MINHPIVDFPSKPSNRFEQQTEPKKCGTWPANLPNRIFTSLDNSNISSSSCSGTPVALRLKLLQSPTYTASWINVSESIIDQLHAEERAASVNINDAPENLFELRRLIGFTWHQLANLLNVDRRTLNNWVKGANIRKHNRFHIAETLKVLRYADRGSAELNSAALNRQHPQIKLSPLESIRNYDYGSAKQWLSDGISRQDRWKPATDSTPLHGEFQPIVMHPDADGTEIIESLTYESEPVSRKRLIRRG